MTGGGVSVGGGRRKRRGIRILPAMFTLGNCLCGFVSLGYAARGAEGTGPDDIYVHNFEMAGYFVFIAMAFDLVDGFVARLTRSASDFGAELDSLADMVSFGVAPAFLSLKVIADLMRHSGPAVKDPAFYLPAPFSEDNWLRLVWVIAAIYVCCTALRLARFNVLNKHDVTSHMNFRGMPSPGAAAVMAASMIFFEALYAPNPVIPWHLPAWLMNTLQKGFPYALPLLLLAAALLMVSRFAYAHLVNRFLRGRKKFRHLVGMLLLTMLFVWQPKITVLLGFYVYALSAPVSWLMRRMTGRPIVVKVEGDGSRGPRG